VRTSDAERVGLLFDYAASRQSGFTYQDVERDLGWPKPRFTKVHRQLRRVLGGDDQINLVCDPQGRHEPWLYRLVGDVDGAKLWVGNRIRDSESRISTVQSVCASLVRATDRRTADGRRARIMDKGLTRIMEDLAELGENGSPLLP
jgi:hypothetical protein